MQRPHKPFDAQATTAISTVTYIDPKSAAYSPRGLQSSPSLSDERSQFLSTRQEPGSFLSSSVSNPRTIYPEYKASGISRSLSMDDRRLTAYKRYSLLEQADPILAASCLSREISQEAEYQECLAVYNALKDERVRHESAATKQLLCGATLETVRHQSCLDVMRSCMGIDWKIKHIMALREVMHIFEPKDLYEASQTLYAQSKASDTASTLDKGVAFAQDVATAFLHRGDHHNAKQLLSWIVTDHYLGSPKTRQSLEKLDLSDVQSSRAVGRLCELSAGPISIHRVCVRDAVLQLVITGFLKVKTRKSLDRAWRFSNSIIRTSIKDTMRLLISAEFAQLGNQSTLLDSVQICKLIEHPKTKDLGRLLLIESYAKWDKNNLNQELERHCLKIRNSYTQEHAQGIITAAKANRVGNQKALRAIKNHPRVQQSSQLGRTLSHYVLSLTQPEELARLLQWEGSLDFNARDALGQTPLQALVPMNPERLIKAYQAAIDVSRQSISASQPASHAESRKSAQSQDAEYSADHQAIIESEMADIKDAQHRIECLQAAYDWQQSVPPAQPIVEIFRQLLSSDLTLDLTSHDKTGRTILHTVIEAPLTEDEHCELIRLLVKHTPVLLNQVDQAIGCSPMTPHGRTPLHYAAGVPNSVKVLTTLFDLGATDLTVQDAQGNTPMHLAASVPCSQPNILSSIHQCLKIQLMEVPDTKNVIWLLDKGADKDAINFYGDTPASHATRAENPLTLRWLWDNDANFNLSGTPCSTPLKLALVSHQDIAILLIELHAAKGVPIEQLIGDKHTTSIGNSSPALLDQTDYELLSEVAYNAEKLSQLAKDWYNSIYDAVETGEYLRLDNNLDYDKEAEEDAELYQKLCVESEGTTAK